MKFDDIVMNDDMVENINGTLALTHLYHINIKNLDKLEKVEIDLNKKEDDVYLKLINLSFELMEKYNYNFPPDRLLEVLKTFNNLGFLNKKVTVHYFDKPNPLIITDNINFLIFGEVYTMSPEALKELKKWKESQKKGKEKGIFITKLIKARVD